MSTTTSVVTTQKAEKRKRSRNNRSILQRCVDQMIVYKPGKRQRKGSRMKPWEVVANPKEHLLFLYEKEMEKAKPSTDRFDELLGHFGDDKETVKKALVCEYGECLVLDKKYKNVKVYLKDKPTSLKRRILRREEFEVSGIGMHVLTTVLNNENEWDRAINDKKLQGNHRCHNDRCVNEKHVRMGTKNDNEANNRCCAWKIVDNKLVSACGCPHQCILPGPKHVPKDHVMDLDDYDSDVVDLSKSSDDSDE